MEPYQSLISHTMCQGLLIYHFTENSVSLHSIKTLSWQPRPRSVTTLTQVPDSFIVLWVSKEHFQSIDPILFTLFNLELILESIYH